MFDIVVLSVVFLTPVIAFVGLPLVYGYVFLRDK